MEETTLAQIAQALGAELVECSGDQTVTGISIDSRTATHGDLFVALAGERTDGHAYVGAAAAAGATGALIARAHLTERPQGVAALVVDDPLSALQRLSTWYRDRLGARVVGITGSNGKTSTKDLTRTVLEHRGPVLATRGNQNTDIGLPLTLLSAGREHWAMVLEMGMRAQGEIRQLASIAHPEIGVVTNVGPSHLETLGTLDNVAAAKGELVEALPKDGAAVLNADDPRVAKMTARTAARPVLFGFGPEADVRATSVEADGLRPSRFTLGWQGRDIAVELPLLGRHQVSNALAAAAVGLTLGLSLEHIAAALRSARLSDMRMQVEEHAGVCLINDAYNASPVSMRAGLQTLGGAPGRKLAILADMLELGSDSARYHREIGAYAAEQQVELLLTVGEGGTEIAAGAKTAGLHHVEHVDDAETAGRRLAELARAGDTVLVKGSRGMALERSIAAFKAATTA